jgi:hypothetical protein
LIPIPDVLETTTLSAAPNTRRAGQITSITAASVTPSSARRYATVKLVPRLGKRHCYHFGKCE